jgi:hypothetical protein
MLALVIKDILLLEASIMAGIGLSLSANSINVKVSATGS